MLNGDIFAFANRAEAQNIVDELTIANDRWDLTIADVYNICQVGLPSPSCMSGEELLDGWKRGTLNDIKIKKVYDAYLICMPPKNIEEDKNMANRNTTTKTPVHLYNYEDSPEDVEFEKKRKELMDEAEKKILDIRKELAVALDKLDEERFEQEMQRRDAMQAKAWKRKYDALIAEGFSVEQAWEMTMKWFEAD